MRKIFNKRIYIWLGLALCVVLTIGFFEQFSQKESSQAIEAMSWVVAGRIIIIDPGHGGEDPGKVSPSGVYEKDINLAVAKKLYTLLNDGGAQVFMTREDDKALSNGENTVKQRKMSDLQNRVELSRSSQADLYIALHCNSFPQGKWNGAQTFYAASVPGSKELAEYVQEELVSYLGNTSRKPKKDSTSLIFKESIIPIVNIEMGFLSNPQEEKLLQESAYQDKVVWSIYSGIVRYLVEYGDSYKPTINYVNNMNK